MDLQLYFGMRQSKERSLWSFNEDQLLLKYVKELGQDNYNQIANLLCSKTNKQVYFRLRYLKQLFVQKRTEQRTRNMYRGWFEFFEQV
ncbi:SANT/Myb_domain [Hexamita inflata]|uniref:SANT/Myb domain n=1 Tax=Hexamita inflata TaxID=28002 RepID=A0AA86PSD8_9EUKA|nr:SANT/Myb domain [Hexamita inflata]